MRRLVLTIAPLIAAVEAHGQADSASSGRAPTPAEVRGRVMTPIEKSDPAPVLGAVVTLHRVGSDSSGAIDSVRTGTDGSYAIRYSRFGDDGAIYFATAMYRGIAYFSAPLQSARVSGPDGDIIVYDTTTRRIEIHVQGHHVVVSAPRPNGVREIVEVWELSNDENVTAVGRDSLTPVWSAPFPRGATNLVGGDGDVAASTLVQGNARVNLIAAFGPGVKQVSYSYSVPPSAFPLVIPTEDLVGVLEVLLEEPMARVTGGSLAPTDAATTGGRTFKRFLAQNAPPGDSLRIDVPTTTTTARTRVLAGLAGLIVLSMAGALVVALRRRRPRPDTLPRDAASEAEALVAEIAALDTRREGNDPSLGDAAYTARRTELKARLAATLAASTPRP